MCIFCFKLFITYYYDDGHWIINTFKCFIEIAVDFDNLKVFFSLFSLNDHLILSPTKQMLISSCASISFLSITNAKDTVFTVTRGGRKCHVIIFILKECNSG